MQTNTGEIAALIAVVGVVLSGLGITGIDTGMVSNAVQGVIAIVTFAAAILSWYHHRQANTV